MPTVGIWLIFNANSYISYSTSDPTKLITTLAIFMGTFMLPALVAVYLWYSGQVSSLHMPKSSERILPFLLTAIIYCGTYYIIKQLHLLAIEFYLPSVIYLIIMGATFSVLTALIINFKWKISVHMIGIGGLLGTLLGISFKYAVDMKMMICGVILIAGLVGFSRLKLKAHSLAQVYAGFFLGMFSELVFILSA